MTHRKSLLLLAGIPARGLFPSPLRRRKESTNVLLRAAQIPDRLDSAWVQAFRSVLPLQMLVPSVGAAAFALRVGCCSALGSPPGGWRLAPSPGRATSSRPYVWGPVVGSAPGDAARCFLAPRANEAVSGEPWPCPAVRVGVCEELES